MNKKLSILFMMPLFVLASCNGVTPGSDDARGTVIDKAFIDANTSANIVSTENKLSVKDIKIAAEISSVSELGCGVYVKKTDGTEGIYDPLREQWLINFGIYDSIGGEDNTYYYETDIFYSTIKATVGGVDKYTTTLINRRGENIYVGSGRYVANSYSVNSDKTFRGVETEIHSFQILDDDGNTNYFYVKYTIDKMWNIKLDCVTPDFLPDQIANEGEDYFSTYGMTSLEEYGLAGYYAATYGSSTTIFDSKGNIQSTFHYDSSLPYYMADGKLVYQESFIVDDYNTDYNYINASGQKCILKTLSVDVLSGKQEEIEDCKFVFSTASTEEYYAADGIIRYAGVTGNKIHEDKTLDTTSRKYLLDKNAQLFDDITTIGDFGNLNHIGSHYVHTNGTVYDEHLNEKGILNNVYGRNNAGTNSKGYVTSKDPSTSLYGLIDEDLNVILPFEYLSIQTYGGYNKVLAYDKNNKLEVISLDFDKKSYSVETDLADYTIEEEYFYGVYCLQDSSSKYHLYNSEDGKIFDFNIGDSETLIDTSYTCETKNSIYSETYYKVYTYADGFGVLRAQSDGTRAIK